MPLSQASGPVPALASLYEHVMNDFKKFIRAIPSEQITKELNPNLPTDFRSIANTIRHVVFSGYQYANYIRIHDNRKDEWPEIRIGNREEAIAELDKMFALTLNTFEGIIKYTDDQLLHTIIKTSWSTYDLEALIEHAIVHVMRHQRQIGNWL